MKYKMLFLNFLLLFSLNKNIFSAEAESVKKVEESLSTDQSEPEPKGGAKRKRLHSDESSEEETVKTAKKPKKDIKLSSILESNIKSIPAYSNISSFSVLLDKYYLSNANKFKKIYSKTKAPYHPRITDWNTNPQKTIKNINKKVIRNISSDSKEATDILQLTHDFPYAFDYFLKETNQIITNKGIKNFIIPGSIEMTNNTKIYGMYTWAEDKIQSNYFYHRSMKLLSIKKPNKILEHEIQSEEIGENKKVLSNARQRYNRSRLAEKYSITTIIFCEQDESIAFESEAAIYGIKMKYPDTLFIFYKNPAYGAYKSIPTSQLTQ